jgi:hypothetical protein
MDMSAKLMVLPALLALGAGSLPAVDPQLLSLVMPGAQVLAGVNVTQAEGTPFGQYVLTQIQSNSGQHLQNLKTLTGFDPSQDLTELLLAATAPSQKNGLVLARGVFDASKISTAATQGGATSKSYKGVTIIEGPKANGAVAFPSTTLAIAGDPADVEAAIDRLTAPATVNPALAALATEVSAHEDAWVASTLPPSAFPQAAQNGAPVQTGVFQNITQFSGGVKFGNTVALSGQAQTQTAQDASNLASVLQFLANMAATNSKAAGPLAGAIGSAAISAQGNTVTVTASLSEDQFQQLVKLHAQRAQTSRAPR